MADAVEQPEDCPAEVLKDTIHHLEQLTEDNPQDDLFEKVTAHGWDNGIHILEIEWKTGETSSHPFTLVKRDYPYTVAQYILAHSVGTWDGRHMSGRYMRCAHGFLRQVNHMICWLYRVASGSILRLCDGRQFQLDDSFHGFRSIRQATTTSKTTQPNAKRSETLVVSVMVNQCLSMVLRSLRTQKHAEELDAQHSNSLWKEAYQKEIASFLSLGCFEFRPPDSKPGPEYQFVK